MKEDGDKLKTYNFREFKKILEENGYVRDHATGSHLTYIKEGDKVVITNNRINKMVARRLIKEHGLEVMI